MAAKVLEFTPRPAPEPQIVKVLVCGKCRHESDAGLDFCGKCGNRLTPEPKKQRYTPKKKQTKVPLKTEEEIKAMAQVLATPSGNTEYKRQLALRNVTLFHLNIHLGLRVSDLIRLKVSDFFTKDGRPRQSATLYVQEKKTKKGREIEVRPQVAEMLSNYVQKAGLQYDDWLAWSRRAQEDTTQKAGSNRNIDLIGEKVISGESYANIITKAAKELGWASELYGSHTLRKTFGYRMYRNACIKGSDHGRSALTTICKIFGHSSEAITMIYIGIDKEEIMALYEMTADEYDWAAAQAQMDELSE